MVLMQKYKASVAFEDKHIFEIVSVIVDKNFSATKKQVEF